MKIGIDFGSTYSTVSKFDAETGCPVPIAFSEGEPASIPSAVCVSRNGQITCGSGAKRQAGRRTARLFEAFKMLLPERNQEMLERRGYDSAYTPRTVAGVYLQSVLSGILRREQEECFEEVVICVPETWNSNVRTLDGRNILRDILEHSLELPIGHVRVVTEPEAASAFFAWNYEKQTGEPFNGYLLLIDYGGGTLDIALTEVVSDGLGHMEIRYIDGGGAGENHPDREGYGDIGSAGIAYMQNVLLHALRDEELIGRTEMPDYSCPAYTGAMAELESQLKSPERSREIEERFGIYGRYRKMGRILEEEPEELMELEYGEALVPVFYQQLFQAYQETVEPVLEKELQEMNQKVSRHIGCEPDGSAGETHRDFKIALTGGFGSFYLVRAQIADICRMDADLDAELKAVKVSADKREQAVSLGAALLAAGQVIQRKIARYSIGLYGRGAGEGEKGRIYYGIRCRQPFEPDVPYFLLTDEEKPDVPENRAVWAALHGNIRYFVIGNTEEQDRGILMRVKPEILERLNRLPKNGLWNCGFSMDESERVTFHLVPCSVPGIQAEQDSIQIGLESYEEMFDLTVVEEVQT